MSARPGHDAGSAARAHRRRPGRGLSLWLLALVASLVIAAVVSRGASEAPDGLERVAVDHGFARTAQEHDLAGSPLAGYEADGVADGPLSGSVAGVAGVVVTLASAGALLWASRRRAGGTPAAEAHDRSGG